MSEQKFAIGVLKIANQNPNGIATFKQCRAQIGKWVHISPEELVVSKKRKPEPMWHQIIRNIKSHSNIPGNFVYEGYLEHVSRVGFKITQIGKNYLVDK